MTKSTTPDQAELIVLGEQLFGPFWRLPMSKALGVNERTLRRWRNGQSTVNQNALDELRKMFMAHAAKMAEQAKRYEGKQ